MSTFREAIYMVLDLLKLDSDDAFYTEEHVAYLLDKYRAYVLKTKEESNPTGEVSDSNYQTLELELEEYMPVEECGEFGRYLRTKQAIQDTMDIADVKIYAPDYFKGRFTFVTPERFRYVNSNKYTQNFIYATIGDDNRVYLKSHNPQMFYLEKIAVRGIFESAIEMAKIIAENSDKCITYLDTEFPLQADLIGLVIDYVCKVLVNSVYKPEDQGNNAHDDLEGLAIKGINTK